LNISGYLGEIPRLRYGNDKITDPILLAEKVGLPKTPYILNELRSWIDLNSSMAEQYNILLSDLFYWEIKYGNWGVQFSSELDIAIEEFYPFNCRDLVLTLYSAEENLRTNYNPVVYIQLIKSMKKSLLRFKINGFNPLSTLKVRRKLKFHRVLKGIHLFDILKQLKRT
jgi:hypothetical protein